MAIIVNAQIVNWVAAFGFPVTEPFWTTIRVNGQDRMILAQAFQRRILTYSPNNPDGWKVEMGNVGAQYYTWRYETPSLVCQRVPVRGFGTVWANHRNVQSGLGCPQTYPAVRQRVGGADRLPALRARRDALDQPHNLRAGEDHLCLL